MAKSLASLGFALLCLTLLSAMPPTVFAAGAPEAMAFAPHRAVYELRLGQNRGQRALESVRGRIVYDFSGNACDGYDLHFRQVSELNNGEGKISLTDLRATTWEDGSARKFQFNSQSYTDKEGVDLVDGKADRNAEHVTVELTKPNAQTLELQPDIVFPTELNRQIVDAARAGKTTLQLSVYDGSETGEKVFDTLTVIGREIRPGSKKLTDAVSGKPALKDVKRWPVTVSYFEKNLDQSNGEQTPAYTLAFELYENGISRALILDYGDFTVVGEMTKLDIKNAQPCK
jgi:EipB-like